MINNLFAFTQIIAIILIFNVKMKTKTKMKKRRRYVIKQTSNSKLIFKKLILKKK